MNVLSGTHRVPFAPFESFSAQLIAQNRMFTSPRVALKKLSGSRREVSEAGASGRENGARYQWLSGLPAGSNWVTKFSKLDSLQPSGDKWKVKLQIFYKIFLVEQGK